MQTLKELCHNYKSHLRDEAPLHYDSFCNLLKSRPECAHAEAAVFSFLNSNRLKVKNYEDPSRGGPDFICEGFSKKFVVEVTALDSESASNHSGIPNYVPDKIEAFPFKEINYLLKRKATEKTRQVSGIDLPRVLAITIEHSHSGVLFGTNNLQSLMTGDVKFEIPLNESNANMIETTRLDNSVFFKYSKDGEIVPCRQSISSIITIEIFENECRILGLLHPEPVIPFSPAFLPTIPFLKLVEWPINKNKIFTEWVIYNPEGAKFYYTYGIK